MTRLRPSHERGAIAAAVTEGVEVDTNLCAIRANRAASPVSESTATAPFGTLILLLFAIAIGAFLRFFELGRNQMSADEGASWAAASAPAVIQVFQLQPHLNPGKFALHEILLHGWIRLFGDSVAAMRALSALAGVLGIIVVFFLARELLEAGAHQAATEEKSSHTLPAALAALLFAVSLVFIKYAQEARMYSVALLCALIQCGFFLRSVRRPRPLVLFLTALFTALAIAGTFTMVLMILPEMLWLVYLYPQAERRHIAYAGLAVISGLLLLIPAALIYLHARAGAPALLAYAWASRPPVWAPISMFNKATGSITFPLMLGLAMWGIACGWCQQREAIVFMLQWMLVPPILMLAASYLIRPAFVERYMLTSFVPFFLLVALGIWTLPGFAAQSVLLVLSVLLTAGHGYSYWQHPHDVQWREAVVAAASDGGTITVAPPFAADVVRYYVRELHKDNSIVAANSQLAAAAIVADTGVSNPEAASIASAYPRLLIRLRGVIVREH
jgi:uncharacterized membrane protein